MARAYEVNFDGIVGPTHNYAGLSYGNIASQRHAMSRSSPKAAALQGLEKMKFLHELGVRQAVLPPHPRPDLGALRRLGFGGSDEAVLREAHRQDPRLLSAAYSASPMWAANAATVSPGGDTADGRVHFTPANLITQFHRSLEAPVTAAVLRGIFPEGELFAHHELLPAAEALADEGAANHMRLCGEYGGAGVEVFVFGRSGGGASGGPARFPARQTREAAAAIARLHRLDPGRVVWAQQSPEAVDAGAFHNDVVAVSNGEVLLCHASAWVKGAGVIEEIRRKFVAACGREPVVIAADPKELSLADAVESYIFNSQIVTLPDETMALIAPRECRDHAAVQRFLGRVIGGGGPIRSVHYLDVRQSMRNGGGPACLRLRVVLTEAQLAGVAAGVMFDQGLYERLVAWVGRHYRDELGAEDLVDLSLARESGRALAELETLLGTGAMVSR